MSDNSDVVEETYELPSEDTVETGDEGSSFLADAPSEETLALLGIEPEEETSEEVPEVKAEETTEETTEEVEKVEEDSRFSKAFTQLSRKEKDLAIREEKLKDVSQKLEEVQQAAENFSSQPVEYLKAQLAIFSGNDDPEAINKAFGDMYETLTMHMLGVDAPSEMKEQNQYQKLQRDFETYKQEQESEKTRLEEEALESQRSVKVTQAQTKIKTQLVEAKESFPYLLAQGEQDPGELVFEVVWQDYNQQLENGVAEPAPMSIEEAASKANTHFQQIAQKWASIIPSAPTTTTPSTGQPATNRPGNSRTLTNSKASVAPTREASTYIDDDEESKLRAMELLQLT